MYLELCSHQKLYYFMKKEKNKFFHLFYFPIKLKHVFQITSQWHFNVFSHTEVFFREDQSLVF